jgi:dynactin-6
MSAVSSGGVGGAQGGIVTGAVVCVEAEITGDVRIGTKSIVHPCAKIKATKGPILIGEANIIEELVTIQNK